MNDSRVYEELGRADALACASKRELDTLEAQHSAERDVMRVQHRAEFDQLKLQHDRHMQRLNDLRTTVKLMEQGANPLMAKLSTDDPEHLELYDPMLDSSVHDDECSDHDICVADPDEITVGP